MPHLKHVQLLVADKLAASRGINVAVYRLDVKHSKYSGNKFYKLLPLTPLIKQHQAESVLSFGGAWSNHLLALSQFCRDSDIASVGVVRSPSGVIDNPLLSRCRSNGMQLRFVSAAEYRQRADPDYLVSLQNSLPRALLLPEGGTSAEAIVACEQIGRDICDDIPETTHVVLAVGTGGTMAGLCRAMPKHIEVCGVPVIKRFDAQRALLQAASGVNCSWRLARAEQNGSYGQLSPAIADFISDFEQRWSIALDPNYTAKAFYWFYSALVAGEFEPGATVVLLHTGGLLGRLGYPQICNRQELALIASH